LSNWKLTSTFDFEGREIKYDIKGQGYPLVLVHGTPWSSFTLRHLILDLCHSYKVYYFDLLGYGQSDKKEGDVSLGIQNRVLKALIKHWKLKNPFIIAHDFGGTTALRNHILDKQEYKKMVLIDPVALSPWGSDFFKHIQKHESAFSTLPEYIHLSIVEAYIKTAAFQNLDEETIKGILLPWSKEGQGAFYRQIAQADSCFTKDFEEKFTQINTSVLLLWGEEDKWIPCKQAKLLQGKIKGSRLVLIPKAGHLVIEEKPAFLLKEIHKFLER